jgi:hypothetical protein
MVIDIVVISIIMGRVSLCPLFLVLVLVFWPWFDNASVRSLYTKLGEQLEERDEIVVRIG